MSVLPAKTSCVLAKEGQLSLGVLGVENGSWGHVVALSLRTVDSPTEDFEETLL